MYSIYINCLSFYYARRKLFSENWHPSLPGIARFPARLPENGGARAQATTLERSQSGTRKMTRRNDRERGKAYRARGRAQVPLISMQNAGLGRGARVVPPCPPFAPAWESYTARRGRCSTETTPACSIVPRRRRASELFASLYASLCASRIADAITKRYRTPSTRVPRLVVTCVPLGVSGTLRRCFTSHRLSHI